MRKSPSYYSSGFFRNLDGLVFGGLSSTSKKRVRGTANFKQCRVRVSLHNLQEAFQQEREPFLPNPRHIFLAENKICTRSVLSCMWFFIIIITYLKNVRVCVCVQLLIKSEIARKSNFLVIFCLFVCLVLL